VVKNDRKAEFPSQAKAEFSIGGQKQVFPQVIVALLELERKK
jgi:hypothetical protein